MHVLVKQFHYTGGFTSCSKIPTETWAMPMSLLKLLIQCQNYATFKNPDQSDFDKYFKQLVESGPYEPGSCFLKHLTSHSNTLTLYICREEMNSSQKNKKPLYLPLCSRGARTTTEKPEPAAERESGEQWKGWSQSAANKMMTAELPAHVTRQEPWSYTFRLGKMSQVSPHYKVSGRLFNHCYR